MYNSVDISTDVYLYSFVCTFCTLMCICTYFILLYFNLFCFVFHVSYILYSLLHLHS